MITGVDYVLYSNKSPVDIEMLFISAIKNKWRTLIINEFERNDLRLELFFAKDKEMYISFDDTGYSLNEHNEGCFMFVASILKKFDSEVKILNIFSPESKSNTAPYNSAIILNDIWEYTLVLPSEINESEFCRGIYSNLENLLRM